MSDASRLTNDVINYVYRQGGYAFRASSVGVYDGKLQTYRAAPKKGVSDVIAAYKGRFIAIEVKIGKDRLSAEQDGFLRNIEAVGGLAYVAKNIDEFMAWFDREKLIIDKVIHNPVV